MSGPPRLEVVTPEWLYVNDDLHNFEEILSVKEKRRIGATRVGSSLPQAPPIEVRAWNLPEGAQGVMALLWNFGVAMEGDVNVEPDLYGQPLMFLRNNVNIECRENTAQFTANEGQQYRTAILRCMITRGARIQCRKSHIALKIVVVDSQGMEITHLPWVRTARMSISEKVMCPRESKRSMSSNEGSEVKKKKTSPSPQASQPALRLTAAPLQPQNQTQLASAGMRMMPGSSLGNPLQAPTFVSPGMLSGMPLERQMRISRMSFGGLDDDLFGASVGHDEASIAEIESLISRRISGTNWFQPSFANSFAVPQQAPPGGGGANLSSSVPPQAQYSMGAQPGGAISSQPSASQVQQPSSSSLSHLIPPPPPPPPPPPGMLQHQQPAVNGAVIQSVNGTSLSPSSSYKAPLHDGNNLSAHLHHQTTGAYNLLDAGALMQARRSSLEYAVRALSPALATSSLPASVGTSPTIANASTSPVAASPQSAAHSPVAVFAAASVPTPAVVASTISRGPEWDALFALHAKLLNSEAKGAEYSGLAAQLSRAMDALEAKIKGAA